MNDEADSAPPPPDGMTPRKPWTKPTLTIIGETVHSVRGGTYAGVNENDPTLSPINSYAPES